MFKVILIVLFVAGTAFANPPANTYRSTKNIHGGYNYYDRSGRMLANSRQNVFGGQNYYNRSQMYNQTYKTGNSIKSFGMNNGRR